MATTVDNVNVVNPEDLEVFEVLDGVSLPAVRDGEMGTVPFKKVREGIEEKVTKELKEEKQSLTELVATTKKWIEDAQAWLKEGETLVNSIDTHLKNLEGEESSIIAQMLESFVKKTTLSTILGTDLLPIFNADGTSKGMISGNNFAAFASEDKNNPSHFNYGGLNDLKDNNKWQSISLGRLELSVKTDGTNEMFNFRVLLTDGTYSNWHALYP